MISRPVAPLLAFLPRLFVVSKLQSKCIDEGVGCLLGTERYGKIYSRDNLRQQVSSPLAQLVRRGALADEGPTVLQATMPRVRDAGF